MKKIVLVILSVLSLGVFASCETHVGDKVIETPWWVILVVLGVYLVLHVTIKAITMSRRYFVCKSCEHRFKPKWYSCLIAQFLFETVDGITCYTLKCPECGEKVQAYKDDNQAD
ncbi:MAG: hypothetical protein IJ309_01015 [Clostridia bacterium]|nr:hypothetical protein [Clostridia bacterium]